MLPRILSVIACFQTVKDQVRVCKLREMRLLIHNSHKVQTNRKICQNLQRNEWPSGHCLNAIQFISLLILTFSNRCTVAPRYNEPRDNEDPFVSLRTVQRFLWCLLLLAPSDPHYLSLQKEMTTINLPMWPSSSFWPPLTSK